MEDRPPQEPRRELQRTLFWPFVLVGVGIIWLLSNLGVLSANSLWALGRFWPVLLIAVGLDLILGRGRPWVGAVIGILTLCLVVWLLLAAPRLGLPTAARPMLQTTRLSEPIGQATSAVVKLDLGEAPTTVRGLADSANLVEATLVQRGQARWNVSGEQEKTVTLAPDRSLGLPWIGLFPGPGERWDIGLTEALPLRIAVTGGSGAAELDLSRLQISSFDLDVRSGSMRVRVPATEDRLRVTVGGGSGRLDLTLLERSQIDLDLNVHSGATEVVVGQGTSLKAEIDGGSGRLVVDIPDDAALRFTVREGGSGSVSLPSDLRQVSDGQDEDDDTGTWETPNLGGAGVMIEISVDVGSGSVSVR